MSWYRVVECFEGATHEYISRLNSAESLLTLNVESATFISATIFNTCILIKLEFSKQVPHNIIL